MPLLHILVAALMTTAVSPALAASAASTLHQFTSIDGLLCIRNDFVETRSYAKSAGACAFLCDDRPRCQAFSMAAGWCQLFVFDECSKYVRDCNCTRRAQVFVRQQPGLPPGALCPAGFADDSCGTKYKVYPRITNWDTYKATVGNESGLVIMADVMDSAELSYVKSLLSKYSLSAVFLGGRQLPGSPEPAGGWMWASCNTSVSSSLWSPAEPNDDLGAECTTIFGMDYSGLIDGLLASNIISGVIGKCVSPFN